MVRNNRLLANDEVFEFTFEPFMWNMNMSKFWEVPQGLYQKVVNTYRQIWTPEFLASKRFTSAQIAVVNEQIKVRVTFNNRGGRMFVDSLLMGSQDQRDFTDHPLIHNNQRYMVSGEVIRNYNNF